MKDDKSIYKETLLHLVQQAHTNGFDFRRWFQSSIRPDWPGTDEAITLLLAEHRYFALIFSHEFARTFWKEGTQMSFFVPMSTYSRLNGKGEVETINRKPFTRRTVKSDVWKYHLSQMAMSEDPMLYLQRFMPSHGLQFQQKDGPDRLSPTG